MTLEVKPRVTIVPGVLRRFLLPTLALLLACTHPTLEPAASPDRFLLGGIQVNEPDHEAWVRALHDSGLNSIAVTVYAHQGDWDTDHLWFDDEAEWVVHEIRTAKRAGLHVVLVLRVALDHAFPRNKFLWHGMIMPRTDTQLASWFRTYAQFVRHWAATAQREGVDVLGVASELNALTSTIPVDDIPVLEEYYLNPEKQDDHHRRVLEQGERIASRHLRGSWDETYDELPAFLDDRSAAHREWAKHLTFDGQENHLQRINRRRALLEKHWTAVIHEARRSYAGALTYAANFDQYQLVGFWQHLDLIGVNAYFPLRQHPVPVEEIPHLYPTLEAGWLGILEEMARFRRRAKVADKGVLFTELGYAFRANSTVQPWAADGFSLVGDWKDPELMVWEERPIDYQERALAVRALRRAAKRVDPEMIRGLLYWKLSTVEGHREIEPFVLIVGAQRRDPMLDELLAFVEPSAAVVQ
jgi:hypothetical protein